MASLILPNPYEAITMGIVSIVRVEPWLAATIASGIAIGVSAVLTILYYSLKTKTNRVTDVYLSGEPENVVSMIMPSIAALYWGFIKRFAKSLYKALVDKVHTGSLHDWYKFISSWFALLILLAIIALVLAFVRW
jgi:hypothetical protein